jgi:hypothetical protein
MSANQTPSTPPNTPKGADVPGNSAPSVNGETARNTEGRGANSNSGPYVMNIDGLLRNLSDEERLEIAVHSAAQQRDN